MELSDSTLGDWVGGVHNLLEPLIGALREHVFAAQKLHADDTPIQVLAPGTGKTKTGRLWVYARDDRPSGGTSPPAVWFRYSPDRKGIHPQTHLKPYRGILQADAYAGYVAPKFMLRQRGYESKIIGGFLTHSAHDKRVRIYRCRRNAISDGSLFVSRDGGGNPEMSTLANAFAFISKSTSA